MAYPAKNARNQALVAARNAGKSWRALGREFNINHVTAKRLYEYWSHKEVKA